MIETAVDSGRPNEPVLMPDAGPGAAPDAGDGTVVMPALFERVFDADRFADLQTAVNAASMWGCDQPRYRRGQVGGRKNL
jgi:hypothetical protein